MKQSICILGDSIAKGVMFDARKNRYTVANESFGKQIAQKFDCCVVNLSRFGSTVTDGLYRFEKQKRELAYCQAVFINFGGNDSDFLWQEISAAPEETHQPKTAINTFEQTYLKLIDSVKKNGQTPILLNLPTVDHGKYFSWISRGLNRDNILKWLGGTSDLIYRRHERYNVAVHRIAQMAGVRLVDIRSAFLARRDYSDLLSIDGIHPNEQGHTLITQIVLEQICCL